MKHWGHVAGVAAFSACQDLCLSMKSRQEIKGKKKIRIQTNKKKNPHIPFLNASSWP